MQSGGQEATTKKAPYSEYGALSGEGVKIQWGDPADPSALPDGPFDVVYDNNGKKLDVCRTAIDKYKVPACPGQALPCTLRRPGSRCTASASARHCSSDFAAGFHATNNCILWSKCSLAGSFSKSCCCKHVALALAGPRKSSAVS